jgi:hypothetical protein
VHYRSAGRAGHLDPACPDGCSRHPPAGPAEGTAGIGATYIRTAGGGNRAALSLLSPLAVYQPP